MGSSDSRDANYGSSDEDNGSSKRRLAMLDFDVLDCPVCWQTLSVPVFQCDNGHVVCSSCCPRLRNKCPLCALPIGHNRCRAMERVLESVFVPCRNAEFGCTEFLSYGKKSTHEEECSFSQCTCPLPDCNYTGSYVDLFNHFYSDCISAHENPMLISNFSYESNDKCFLVRMKINDKILVKLEHRRRLVFVVQCFREHYGLYVSVSCIAPSSPEVGEISCNLDYNVDGHVICYLLPEVKKVLQVNSQTPPEYSMLIPQSFLRGEILEIGLHIKMS